MKLHTRALSVLLSLLLLAPAFVSCAESKPDETATSAPDAADPAVSETEAEAEEVFIPDDLPDTDLNGYTFQILAYPETALKMEDTAHLIIGTEVSGDAVNDALFDSKCKVEERFNVGFEIVPCTGTPEGETIFRTSVNGGDHAFDLYIGHDFGTTNLAKEGICLDLRKVPQFNFEKPWWTPDALEAFTVAGRLFCASSYLSFLGLHWTRAITVNKDLAGNLNIDIPYNDVREGTWTLDKLYSLVDGVYVDLDGNGKINAKDQVGFASGSQTWYCMQEAVGISPYKHDENGNIFVDVDVERTQKFVDIMRQLILADHYAESDGFGVELFKNGKAMFAYTQVGDGYDTYRVSDVKYGFLPTPKLDELQENYINCCTDKPWAMPKTLTGDALTAAATVAEALSCLNYNNVLPAYFEGAIKSRIADAPDDTEMLQIIADTRTISFAYTYAMSFANIVNDCVLGKNEVASYFKKGEKVANKVLERMVSKFEAMD